MNKPSFLPPRGLMQSLGAFAVSFVVAAALVVGVAAKATAQMKTVSKPEPVGYPWADKFLNEVYLLDVDVAKSINEIDAARLYLAELAEDPVVFLKEKGSTDFKTVVKLAREKYEQGKAAKKTVDELFAGEDFKEKIKTLGEQLKTLTDKKALSAVGKNLKEGAKNLGAMPKALDKLSARTKSIINQSETVIKQADQLDMFKKAPVVGRLTESVNSLKSTGEKMPMLADVSVKTLDLYKQAISNIK